MLGKYQLEAIYNIAALMIREGAGKNLVSRAINRSESFDGIYDLMVMWRDEPNERSEIIKTLSKALSDIDRAMDDY